MHIGPILQKLYGREFQQHHNFKVSTFLNLQITIIEPVIDWSLIDDTCFLKIKSIK